MNRLVEQPLESRNYCQSGSDVPPGCVCCGTPFPGDDIRCQRCDAPLELSDIVVASVARGVAALEAADAELAEKVIVGDDDEPRVLRISPGIGGIRR